LAVHMNASSIDASEDALAVKERQSQSHSAGSLDFARVGIAAISSVCHRSRVDRADSICRRRMGSERLRGVPERSLGIVAGLARH
jgi:hypothetical protein